jgi:multidrug efflux pump subunit AcrA (membrane-fusion protein)
METKKKRSWVKNAIIIFLAIMLVLTFFSNTIMNLSLPEVATKKIEKGVITPKLRGTGIVKANETYDVTLKENRTIKTVTTKEGKHVAAGDVLFVLEGVESKELEYAKNELKNLERAYNSALLNLTDFDYSQYEWEINKAERNLSDARNQLLNAKEGSAEYIAAKAKVDSLEDSIADLEFRMLEQQKTDEKLLSRQKLELDNYEEDIAAKKAQIEKLEKESAGTEIVSPVSGLVKTVFAYSGKEASYGEVLALIEVTESGYSLSFSVTNEQSELAVAGRKGEVYNYYGGSKLEVQLDRLEVDPDNPSSRRLLVFNIKGEVESGTQLSVSINAKGTEYPYIIPNNAVRQDSNGYYMLVLTSKNTPLGVRYYASRVGIEKLDEDEANTAVSAYVEQPAFTILTSSKPIADGDQVRLPD